MPRGHGRKEAAGTADGRDELQRCDESVVVGVPIGEVVKGMDVVRGIYMGYGDSVNQFRLSPMSKGNVEYGASFPRMNAIKACRLTGQ